MATVPAPLFVSSTDFPPLPPPTVSQISPSPFRLSSSSNPDPVHPSFDLQSSSASPPSESGEQPPLLSGSALPLPDPVPQAANLSGSPHSSDLPPLLASVPAATGSHPPLRSRSAPPQPDHDARPASSPAASVPAPVLGPRSHLDSQPPSASAPSPRVPSSSHPSTMNPSSSIPHQQSSYAQAARGPRGTGFVRSHAAAVESFARLPRIGVNIICGSREGMPSFSFANSDLPKVEGLYSNALVMKFHGGRPSLESSHKEISSWGLEHSFSIGPLNSRAFLLRFQDATDLLKVLSRPSSTLITFPYRVFRWHNLCHLKEESCMTPVWISLPRLPLQCFVPEFLEAVGNKIGRFLCLDKATATLARPSAARLCVEIDLRQSPPDFIWVGLLDGFKQQILYEKLPKFCQICYTQSHSSMECSKGSLDNPHCLVNPTDRQFQSSTPRARLNGATTHTPTSISTSTSSDILPPPLPASQVPPHSDQSHQPTVATGTNPPAHRQVVFAAEPTPSLQIHTNPSSIPQHQPPLTQHQPTSPFPNHHALSGTQHITPLKPSFLSSHRNNWTHKSKSVSFDPRQSNLVANNTFGDSGSNPGATSPSDAPSSSTLPIPAVSQTATAVIQQPGATIQHKQSAAKSSIPQLNVSGISSSLTQHQVEAIERLKTKIREQGTFHSVHQSGPLSSNPFEPLLADCSDDDDRSIASFQSDTEDDMADPIDLGYQSADGRTTNKHKYNAHSGRKINKRHPNLPLSVQLRARKNSRPSTP